eukprot:CAMPEP_0206507424 /NCGR_PEP_ID=MMETSP0324_2-20121206/57506_1 /ASSEMBLY_ACC=CAM_ASM_000836 /TAXON_ID=2866 /ORGANISM="Crypthecodinium cohnii, Strain Seligo" /LENGTH=33 /DNA_ID= /DNA_START= /DNA_END= /DNA_ORIENTATION=
MAAVTDAIATIVVTSIPVKPSTLMVVPIGSKPA